jgi:hypothetical protein
MPYFKNLYFKYTRKTVPPSLLGRRKKRAEWEEENDRWKLRRQNVKRIRGLLERIINITFGNVKIAPRW